MQDSIASGVHAKPNALPVWPGPGDPSGGAAATSATDRNSHLVECTRALLEVLRRHDQRITFFVVGRIFDELPGLVEEIASHGHEIGWHGHRHVPLENRDVLTEELLLSDRFLRAFRPSGFRAPWIYLPEGVGDLLRDAQFTYDSSTTGPAGSHGSREGIQVIPVTSVALLSRFRGASPDAVAHDKRTTIMSAFNEFPLGSGLAYSLLRHWYGSILDHYSSRRKSVVFYIHQWQVLRDPQAKYRGIRAVHRYGILETIERLCFKFVFAPMSVIASNPSANDGSRHFLTVDLE